MSFFNKGQKAYIIDASKRKYSLIECTIMSERDGIIKAKGERDTPYVFKYNETIKDLNGFFADSFKEYFLSDDYENCVSLVERHNLRADILTTLRNHSSEISMEQLKKIKEILDNKCEP